MRLKKWVKITISIVGITIFVMMFSKWDQSETNKCVNGGNTIEFCRKIK